MRGLIKDKRYIIYLYLVGVHGGHNFKRLGGNRLAEPDGFGGRAFRGDNDRPHPIHYRNIHKSKYQCDPGEVILDLLLRFNRPSLWVGLVCDGFEDVRLPETVSKPGNLVDDYTFSNMSWFNGYQQLSRLVYA